MNVDGRIFIFLSLLCTLLQAEKPPQRRALEGFLGSGATTSEAATNAKSACFHWAADFSTTHFVIGTPDCGSCICPLSTEPQCFCYGSLRYEDQFEECAKPRKRRVFQAADASAPHCGKAKVQSSDALWDWHAEKSEKEFVVDFTRPECYCHDRDVSYATCRSSITFLECSP